MSEVDRLRVSERDPVEKAIGECHDRLDWNVRAYGKAWTGEGDDTRFIVAPLADRLRGAVARIAELESALLDASQDLDNAGCQVAASDAHRIATAGGQ